MSVGKSLTRILVVDDDADARSAMQALLEQEGYRVLVAGDGVEALEALNESCPDVLLTDLDMPRMDGDASNAVRAMRAGAEDYLVKPVDFDELSVVLQRVEHGRRGERGARRG